VRAAGDFVVFGRNAELLQLRNHHARQGTFVPFAMDDIGRDIVLFEILEWKRASRLNDAVARREGSPDFSMPRSKAPGAAATCRGGDQCAVEFTEGEARLALRTRLGPRRRPFSARSAALRPTWRCCASSNVALRLSVLKWRSSYDIWSEVWAMPVVLAPARSRPRRIMFGFTGAGMRVCSRVSCRDRCAFAFGRSRIVGCRWCGWRCKHRGTRRQQRGSR